MRFEPSTRRSRRSKYASPEVEVFNTGKIPRTPRPRGGERRPKGPGMASPTPVEIGCSYLYRIAYRFTVNFQLLDWLPAVLGSWSSLLPARSVAPVVIVAT